MRVSIRLILALGLIMGAFIAALYALRVWQNNSIESIVEEHHDMVGRLADTALQLLGNPLKDYAQDYTIWSQMLDFINSADPAWAAENLQPSLQTYGMDAIWVFRKDFSQMYACSKLPQQNLDSLMPPPPELKRLFETNPEVHFFLPLPAGLMEIRGATIHPSSDVDRKTPPAGCLLVGKRWDDALVKRLAELIHGSVTLQLRQNTEFPPDARHRHGQAILFHRVLSGWNGQPVARLEVHTHTPVTEDFFGQFNTAILAAALFSFAMMALLSALIARWVALPLNAISAALTKADPAPLGNLQDARTEFGTIARLVAAHFEQRHSMQRDMEERRRFSDVQSFLLHCGQNAPDTDFFQALAAYLAETLEMDYVCIDRLLPDGLMAQTVAICYDGRIENNAVYALAQTPCGDAAGRTVCCFPKDVRNLFPQDAVLQEMRAESYIGTTLWGTDGSAIGLIAVIGRRPLADPSFAESVLQLVAVRAAAELERRDAEDALFENREQLRAVLENGFDAFFIMQNVYGEDGQITDFRICEVSARGAQLVERTRHELIGGHLCQLFPFHKTEGFFEKYRRVAEEGSMLDEEVLVRAHPENGVPNDLWLHHSVVPIRGGIAIASSVINERKQAEANLRESEKRFASAFAHAPAGMAIVSLEGHWLKTNTAACAMLGYTEEELRAMRFHDVTLPEDLPADLAQMQTLLLRKSGSYTLEKRYIHKQGHVIWALLSVSLVCDAQGNPSHFLSQIIDITPRKRAEEALRQSELFSVEIQKLARLGGWKANPHTDYLEWTSGIYQILEEPAEYRPGLKEGIKYYLPEYQPLLRENIVKCLESGAPFSLECKVRTATGKHLWAEVRGLAQVTEGEHSYVMGTLQDITDRKRADEELRHRENLLRKVFEILPVGLWFADGTGRLLMGNAAGQRIWGAEPLVGSEEFGVFRGRRMPSGQEIAPDDWALAHTISKGVTILDEEIEIEAFDGKKRTILNYSAPVLADDGTVEAAVVVNLDITDRKRAEEAWRASQARYRSLFDSATDGILILEASSGRIIDANPAVCAMLGKPESGIVGQRIWQIPAFAPIAASRQEFQRIQESDSSRHEDTHLRRDTGDALPVEFLSTVYSVGNDTVVQCNLRDISERRRLEDQLRQVQKMDAVGQLAGGVAHDFNNLLQVILGNVGLLQRMQPPGSPTWDEVEEVRKAAERAAELTQQLLAFSRRQTIQPVDIDLNELVHGVLKMLRRLIGEHIELCFIPGSALENTCVDRGQIEQVLMNLSVNARDAMPRGGKLVIRTENSGIDAGFCRENPWAAEGNYVLISVSDNGRGMDADTRARIFEPFFSTKEVGQGTGLGLATVYGIVKQHNGLIHVESLPQRGTVFYVYLPAAEHPQAVPQKTPKPPVWGGTETILVAEDEPAVLNLIASPLRTVGYSVLTAADGTEAVRVFAENPGGIDLALLDVVMPGLSGREAMERMKLLNPKTCFLFSSGYSASAIHKDFVIDDGLHLIRKPYRREDLLHAVRRILDTRTQDDTPASDTDPETTTP